MRAPAIDLSTTCEEFRKRKHQVKYKESFSEADFLPLGGKVQLYRQTSVVGNCQIHQLRTRTGIAFRRSWQHIRRDKTDFLFCYFARRGRIAISLPSTQYLVGPGQCAILRSTSPFLAQHFADKKDAHESMHVHIPANLFCPALVDGVELGKPLPTQQGGLHIAERMLELLFEQDDHLESETAESLISVILLGVIRAFDRTSDKTLKRQSTLDRRSSEIIRCIDRNFANRDLSASAVAKACGISVRYMCHVLRQQGRLFSDILWETRLNMALKWLSDSDMRHYRLNEISQLVGFKSNAHFSRAFRQRYHVTATEYRARPELIAGPEGGITSILPC